MGEDVSDMATTTSQLQAKLLALTGGKVDIMIDANTFKNSTEINYMSPYEETYMLCA